MTKTFFSNHYGSETDLKKHYYELCKTHHPDKGGSDEMFIELNNQYKIKLKQTQDDPDRILNNIYKFNRTLYGKDYKVAIMDGVVGDGSLKSPFIGTVEKYYYKDWIIYKNAGTKPKPTTETEN